MYVMTEYGRDFGIPLRGGRVAIQGFGNVGGNLARLLHAEAGAKVVAVSDVSGGVANEQGLDVPALLAHSAAGKREQGRDVQDRKSTRLNSSHSQISYAVFCLKKKKSI